MEEVPNKNQQVDAPKNFLERGEEMSETFTSDHFRYWIEGMEVRPAEAAELLGVSLSTIDAHAAGVVTIPDQQAKTCRLLLRLGTKRLRQE